MIRLAEVCNLHGDKSWVECPDCGASGYSGHDCGEDCCCCRHPEDNIRCDICQGKSGWYRCYTCAPMQEHELEDA